MPDSSSLVSASPFGQASFQAGAAYIMELTRLVSRDGGASAGLVLHVASLHPQYQAELKLQITRSPENSEEMI